MHPYKYCDKYNKILKGYLSPFGGCVMIYVCDSDRRDIVWAFFDRHKYVRADHLPYHGRRQKVFFYITIRLYRAVFCRMVYLDREARVTDAFYAHKKRKEESYAGSKLL